MVNQQSGGICVMVAAFAPALTSPVVFAEPSPIDPAEESSIEINGLLGIEWNSHFISYGSDVWGGGDSIDSSPTANAFAKLSLTADRWTVFGGTWFDMNNNADGDAFFGSDIQETDLYTGVSYEASPLCLSLTYGNWNYAGGTEHILDATIAYTGEPLLFEKLPLNPFVKLHSRIDSTGDLSLESGAILLMGINPTYELPISAHDHLTLSAFVHSAVNLEDGYFGAGSESGYAYTAIGAGISAPLDQIFDIDMDAAWSVYINGVYYATNPDTYPNNSADEFFTLTVGMQLNF